MSYRQKHVRLQPKKKNIYCHEIARNITLSFERVAKNLIKDGLTYKKMTNAFSDEVGLLLRNSKSHLMVGDSW